ncbi:MULTISPECIES: GNAT family N-acetyltransferase [unclassified Arthrobacter]|uniref:GNAT family N-acetyltransferase n=1 Tax=unclassified Arthrobacter TaxID=235627 RepID=UPI001E5626A3|nr:MULTISPECIES: GNAT family N-acetyltransferase [unclassified Arthrobacter]MCC9145182.1 N-acetyltransferase family protein [Arthrobacter sp. zg-Y919]MDK1276410.1 N-acetyltransferase family protein [Arthrobacter sp. zg.Y919]WIB01990.1 N-acetyltransferase family protein [Arthrobacter sp. zg-Y919]
MPAAVKGAPPVVRPLLASDWPAVRTIYAAGIAAGQATFEDKVPGWEAFDSAHLPGLRLVAEAGNEILGWAAASPVSPRAAYRGVVEQSVYVAPAAQGRGIGRLLLHALVASAENSGIWTLQCSIFPENTVSLALHIAEGFRLVGRRERVAKMMHGPHAGEWRDTLFLERRSGIVGTD